MQVKDRFLRYVKIDTQSDAASKTTPSSLKQLDLAKVLIEELNDLGLSTKLDQGYVYGHLKSNVDYETKTVGFIAHMDTSPDYSGANVNPRVVEKWDGSPIVLNEDKTISLDKFGHMQEFVGDDLIVTDGNTLLGADDKAGIAIIMQYLSYLKANPGIKHGDIKVGFTPDEEIGRGADLFDVEYFNADFAYTLDGGSVNEFCYETFNAYGVKVDIKGVSIHPGDAKGKLVNAITLANRFDGLLPNMLRPEYTEDKEGFNHLHDINGSANNVVMEYIVRNHSKELINKQVEDFYRIQDYLNAELGYKAVTVESILLYENMYEKLHDKKYILDLAISAIEKEDLKVKIISARGGTDGSRLTFMGLLCPNLGTGGANYHGPYETVSINQMEKGVKVIANIVDSIKENR